VLCNPPYLDENRSAFDADARSSDPVAAIFAGNGGMGSYEDLAYNPALFSGTTATSECATVSLANPPHGLVAPGGAMFLEVPHKRATAVEACLRRSAEAMPFQITTGDLDINILRDTRKLERCLSIRRYS